MSLSGMFFPKLVYIVGNDMILNEKVDNMHNLDNEDIILFKGKF